MALVLKDGYGITKWGVLKNTGILLRTLGLSTNQVFYSFQFRMPINCRCEKEINLFMAVKIISRKKTAVMLDG
jgi:hypothetical protein